MTCFNPLWPNAMVIHPVPQTTAELKGDGENPRAISDRAKVGLRHSLEHFGDLSGIVFNQRTGELVTGHQRVDQLRERYGDRPITPIDEGNGLYGIFVDADHYFPVRVVDWSRAMQRAANVAANNTLIQGTFSDDLADYLLEVEADLETSMSGVLDECLLSDLLRMAAEEDEEQSDGAVNKQIAEIYQVVIDCDNEDEQRHIWNRLTAEGLRCKPLTI